MNALLDVQLSKKLAAGKLFVGQKLRVFHRFPFSLSLLSQLDILCWIP